MVFLFIAFLAIIFLFTTPISVRFNLFFEDLSKKPRFSLEIMNFINYPLKKENSTRPKKKKKRKKPPFKIKLNKKDLGYILKKLLPDDFLLEIKLPESAPAHIVFPVMGVISAVKDSMENLGKSLKLSVCFGGEEIYFQSKIRIKLNLFMIFSAFFQIIRFEYKRR